MNGLEGQEVNSSPNGLPDSGQTVIIGTGILQNHQAIGSPNLHQQQPLSNNPTWIQQVASQTSSGMRAASDQLGHSIRQLYFASASSMGANSAVTSGAGHGTNPSNSEALEAPPSYRNIPGIVPYYVGRTSGPPPSYEDVVNPYAAPPSYQSLFGQVREARKSSRSFLDLLRKLLIIFLSSLGCTVLLAFMIFIPFSMIIVGAIYIDECRIEHIPAFLLVGGLVWATKNVIHCYSQCHTHRDRDRFYHLHHQLRASQQRCSINANSQANQTATTNDPRSTRTHRFSSSSTAGEAESETSSSIGRRRVRQLKSSIYESLLNCVMLGWFIAGCVIVFRNFEPDFENPTSARYCHRTVYQFTFWLITSALMLLGLFIGCICCLMVSSAVASRNDGPEGDDIA